MKTSREISLPARFNNLIFTQSDSLCKVTLLPERKECRMLRLYITKAKPNPAGKDRSGGNISSQQLAGEWVDFQNTGDQPYLLDNVHLQHIAYTAQYPVNGQWEEACDFSGTLPVGEIVRVHSGGSTPLDQLRIEDRLGAHHHVFTGKSYIWNNSRPDTARLVLEINGQTTELDKASYSANPPEGRILVRSGNSLI